MGAETLGEGCFGQVHLGEYHHTICAAKGLKGEHNGAMLRESQLLKNISNHPYICRFFGLYLFDQRVYIIMEYLKDGCALHVVRSKVLSSQQKLCMCAQMAIAVEHVHSNNVLHCDISL